MWRRTLPIGGLLVAATIGATVPDLAAAETPRAVPRRATRRSPAFVAVCHAMWQPAVHVSFAQPPVFFVQQ